MSREKWGIPEENRIIPPKTLKNSNPGSKDSLQTVCRQTTCGEESPQQSIERFS